MNTPKTATRIFQKTYWQPKPHPESTPTRSKKAPKKTFHIHVVSILSLTYTRSKKPSKFGIFFSLNILMKHDQQNCGKKRNLIFTEEYFSGIICLPGKERTKATKFNEYQLTLFANLGTICKGSRWMYLSKDTSKSQKKSFHFGRKEILRNYLKTSTLFISPAQPGVH